MGDLDPDASFPQDDTKDDLHDVRSDEQESVPRETSVDAEEEVGVARKRHQAEAVTLAWGHRDDAELCGGRLWGTALSVDEGRGSAKQQLVPMTRTYDRSTHGTSRPSFAAT